MVRAGLNVTALCESNAWRRSRLSRQFPTVRIFDDVRTIMPPYADVCFGGPPCQATSVAAAIHGYRSGESLWGEMFRAGIAAGCEWFVVEQPPGNAAWEAEVAGDLSRSGRHVAVVEFGANDVGAPYLRRRRYLVASPSLSRLEVAWRSIPQAIDRAKRAANARGDWDPSAIPPFGVDTWRSERVDDRKQRIEALGDSNPPAMAEAIGYMLVEGIAA
jgi:site-specific DNA-cytosine methylase